MLNEQAFAVKSGSELTACWCNLEPARIAWKGHSTPFSRCQCTRECSRWKDRAFHEQNQSLPLRCKSSSRFFGDVRIGKSKLQTVRH